MITITNKNIYYSEYSISTSLDGVEIVYIDDIVSFLSEYVELGESVTIKRIFEIVSTNIDKFNEIFYSNLGGLTLEPYLQEIENNQTEKLDIDYVELYWLCDKYDNDLNISPSLRGISPKLEDCALDFISLNNIKNCIIKINTIVDIFDYNKVMEQTDKKVPINLNIGNKQFTLFELFNAIFYEISFHGGPQDKNEIFKEIEETISEIDLEELQDMKESMSIEDIFKKIEDSDIYLVKYKNLMDRVDIDRISDTQNLDKLKNCLLEKLKIYEEIIKNNTNLHKYYKKLTDIEYNLQLLYGEKEDKTYHKFWETPKCTCPKIDNIEIYLNKEPIFNLKCPIHGIVK
ncbi:hypothetical protein M0Q97_06825 [Candidatus Dojkabacteria bacterium]|jgi:hypothetical protein|nr:hypothetical protein [Candidatus Dojkabacteria bacterium]